MSQENIKKTPHVINFVFHDTQQRSIIDEIIIVLDGFSIASLFDHLTLFDNFVCFQDDQKLEKLVIQWFIFTYVRK